MFSELIISLTQGNEWVDIQPPCPDSEIVKAQEVVGYSFPKELIALLRELNGDKWCLLSAQEIIENVERNRNIFLPLFEDSFSKEEYADRVDRFIFFATNGCGDYYGYRVQADGVPDESAIFIWEHEDLGELCCWKPVASNMTEFITRYYQNEI